MELFLPKWEHRAAELPRSKSISGKEKRAARQAAAGEKRGGGESGLGESKEFRDALTKLTGSKSTEAQTVKA